jgi:hypothetical protein
MCSMVKRQSDLFSFPLRVCIAGTPLVPLHIANDGTECPLPNKCEWLLYMFGDVTERRFPPP